MSKKKRSIREFVHEDDLKFQVYIMKYAYRLRILKEKTEEEIVSQFLNEQTQRLGRMEKDRQKFKTPIAKEAIDYNEKYVLSWEAPIQKESILQEFEEKRMQYIKALKVRADKEVNPTKMMAKIAEAKAVDITNSSKELFGQMLLLMIKNMTTMPSFSGYTENWRTDFYSNAVEKTLLYIHNFDEELRSKRTGEKSKAFAYITQICFNAFVQVINIRKAESDFLKETISQETSQTEGVRTFNNIIEGNIGRASDTVELTVSSWSTSKDILDIMAEITMSNEIIKHNNFIRKEIDYMCQTTLEIDKNQDFDVYIQEYLDQVKKSKYPDYIDVLILQNTNESLPDNLMIPDVDFTVVIKSANPRKQSKHSFGTKAPNLYKENLENFISEWSK